MSAATLRQRPSAKAGEANGGAAAGATRAEAAGPRTVTIDTKSGHMGVTLSNSELSSGVRVDACHPDDLVSKAGIRQGDVLVRLNGKPVDTHVQALAVFEAAANADGALLVEYVAEADAQAAAAPADKRAWVAYALWLGGGALGLHHVYLGRDTHALLHVLSFNGVLGLGWLRDLTRIGAYVQAANGDLGCARQLKADQIASPSPSIGLARYAGMLALGNWFGYLAGCLLPPPYLLQIPTELAVLVAFVLHCAGAALGVHAVGTLTPHTGAFKRTTVGAMVAFVLFIVLGGGVSITVVTLGAIAGFRSSVGWARPTVQRRLRVRPARRVALLLLGTTLGCGTAAVGIFNHGAVAVNTPDGVRAIRISEAVGHFVRSPFFAHMPSVLWRLGRDVPQRGWQHAWAGVIEALDLEGEGHACEALGLAKGASMAEIKRAHRALALELHPDKHADKGEAEQEGFAAKFRNVQEAYETLNTMHSQRKAAAREAGADDEMYSDV